jgi:hypothetical protein
MADEDEIFIYDTMTAEEASEYTRAVNRLDEALRSCNRMLEREEELEATRAEIDELPTILGGSRQPSRRLRD